MNKILTLLIFISYTFLFTTKVKATHVIGGEIGYTHLTGNDYEIYLIIYGDCSGNSFPLLASAIPRIEIMNNGNLFTELDLQPFGVSGLEVTPVCPSQAGNTKCVDPINGTLPGIAQFKFKEVINLGVPSANWQFIFNGSFGNMSQAGRSNAITNIITGSQLMALEATLNNTVGHNNSSYFSTIPTPFFCINTLQEFNQGAVDPDGDQLSFSLVPGLVAGNPIGTVTYISPFTFSNPVAAVPGSFSFNPINGQMSFIPNQIQTSLVVNKVVETRGGVTVGTTMREMNMIVLGNSCTNLSPLASIPTSNVGVFDSLRTLTLCNAVTNLHFVINANDPDISNNVNVLVTGLPIGATSAITNNNTPTPVITIDWILPQPILPGAYTFYVTCEDDGCPLSNKPTFAYTVYIVQPITPLQLVLSKESCVPGTDGSIVVNTASTSGALLYTITGTAGFQTSNVFTGLNSGVYTVIAKDINGCTNSSTALVQSSPVPTMNFVTTPETCLPGKDGNITVIANSVNGSIIGYTINGSAIQTSNIFSNLSAGVYSITSKDIAGCIGTSMVTISPSVHPTIDDIIFKNITCFGKKDGFIQLRVSPTNSYSYVMQPGNISDSSGKFINLGKGNYTIVVTNNKGCSDTTNATIAEPNEFIITKIDIVDASCDKDNATITVETNYTSPLIYTLKPITIINTGGLFNNIAHGFYTINVRDANYCTVDSAIYVGNQPNLFTSNIVHKNLNCTGWGTEGEAEVFASGGVIPYTYLWTTSPASTDKKISNLYYGWYFVNVIDATGCETKDTVYIMPGTCCDSIYIPNAFTPNGDGKNDEWKLVSSTGISIDQFAVYNRWGEKIWDTYDQRFSWDGKRKDGELNVGTYFYLLRYKCLADGKTYIKKGDVTVLK